jgi:hypothetical protein
MPCQNLRKRLRYFWVLPEEIMNANFGGAPAIKPASITLDFGVGHVRRELPLHIQAVRQRSSQPWL